MNEQINEFFNWLDTAKEAVLSEVAALASDGRTDESNSLKAKANVYDICKSVTGTILKKTPGASYKEAFAALAQVFRGCKGSRRRPQDYSRGSQAFRRDRNFCKS